MISMCHIIPSGTCPKCKADSFVVYESDIHAYVTNADGIPISAKNMSYRCEGICMNCKSKFPMLSTPTKFIPLTPLRQFLYEEFKLYEEE